MPNPNAIAINDVPIFPDDGRIGYSPKEVKLMSGFSDSTVHRRIKSGRWPSILSEGRRLVIKSGLEADFRKLLCKADA